MCVKRRVIVSCVVKTLNEKKQSKHLKKQTLLSIVTWFLVFGIEIVKFGQLSQVLLLIAQWFDT